MRSYAVQLGQHEGAARFRESLARSLHFRLPSQHTNLANDR